MSRLLRRPPPSSLRLAAAAGVEALERRQRRHRLLAITIAVLRKYVEDGGGRLSALIAYWGFFSLFPLLLALVTVLAFVLHGDPAAQRAVINSALSNYPIIGPELSHHLHRLNGSPISLAIGLAGTLYAGLGVLNAVQHAFQVAWGIPPSERGSFVAGRLRGLALLAAFGLLLLASTALAGSAANQRGVIGTAVGVALALALNLALFYFSFRIYTPSSVGPRALLPGVVGGALVWQLFQHIGGIYVTHVIRHLSATAGVFALVLGLLVWLYLGARLLVFALELNVVLAKRLYPRSLRSNHPLDADLRALAERTRGDGYDNARRDR